MEMHDTPDGHLYSAIVEKIGSPILKEVTVYLSDKRRINNLVIDDELIYYFEIPPSSFRSRHMGDDNIPEKSLFDYYNFREVDIELIEYVRDLDNESWLNYDKAVSQDEWSSLDNIDESKILYKK